MYYPYVYNFQLTSLYKGKNVVNKTKASQFKLIIVSLKGWLWCKRMYWKIYYALKCQSLFSTQNTKGIITPPDKDWDGVPKMHWKFPVLRGGVYCNIEKWDSKGRWAPSVLENGCRFITARREAMIRSALHSPDLREAFRNLRHHCTCSRKFF